MMTTLAITLYFGAVLTAYSVLATEEKNGLVKMTKGENFILECNTKDNTKDSLILFARLPRKHVVGSYDKHTHSFTLSKEYSERVNISGPMHKLTIRISDMQLEDNGLYIGIYSKFNYVTNEEENEEGCSVLLLVNDVTTLTETSTGKQSSALSDPLVLVFGLTACTLIVVFVLLMWVLLPKVKSQCMNQADDASRNHNPVYEDMRHMHN